MHVDTSDSDIGSVSDRDTSQQARVLRPQTATSDRPRFAVCLSLSCPASPVGVRSGRRSPPFWVDSARPRSENRSSPSQEWACGAAGSALPWHGRGHRFDPDQVHQLFQAFRRPSLPRLCRILVANSKTFPREDRGCFGSEARIGSVVVAVNVTTTSGLRLPFAGFYPALLLILRTRLDVRSAVVPDVPVTVMAWLR